MWQHPKKFDRRRLAPALQDARSPNERREHVKAADLFRRRCRMAHGSGARGRGHDAGHDPRSKPTGHDLREQRGEPTDRHRVHRTRRRVRAGKGVGTGEASHRGRRSAGTGSGPARELEFRAWPAEPRAASELPVDTGGVHLLDREQHRRGQRRRLTGAAARQPCRSLHLERLDADSRHKSDPAPLAPDRQHVGSWPSGHE